VAEALSASLENYLEAIFHLAGSGQAARGRDIASRLAVKPSSVTVALEALRRRGLVLHKRYGGVTLTDAGRRAAQDVARRHGALLKFLVETLGIDAATADATACRMEHGVPRPVADRFAAFVRCVPPRRMKDERGRRRPRVGSGRRR
jgi:DtxR family Mn-dependent transcriptional regulator